MEGLRCVAYATYATITIEMRSEDWAATAFKNAIKRGTLTSDRFYEVPTRRGARQLSAANAAEAVTWWAEWAAHHLRESGATALVPVPASTAVVGAASAGRAEVLADALARASGVGVGSVLRWRTQAPPTRQGRDGRDPNELCDRLAVVGSVGGWRCALVDDVVTTGGHALACARRLQEAGAHVLVLLVGVRAFQGQVVDPWADVDSMIPWPWP